MKGKKKIGKGKGKKKKGAPQALLMKEEVLCSLFWATFWLRNNSPKRSKALLENISGQIDAAGEERSIFSSLEKKVEKALQKAAPKAKVEEDENDSAWFPVQWPYHGDSSWPRDYLRELS
ncbi:hypothetical protein FOZ60_002794 [Perkinsus olseni]|uniref:Uncharacterized protein n=1 Tax=Perkinsus olseni TaxID=32597 RepID=A0A7J6NX43_PEROL|nr:hypothetical protein FOZ60_002794 [Perkinsus olseni]